MVVFALSTEASVDVSQYEGCRLPVGHTQGECAEEQMSRHTAR